jgi:hypothetical protein
MQLRQRVAESIFLPAPQESTLTGTTVAEVSADVSAFDLTLA